MKNRLVIILVLTLGSAFGQADSTAKDDMIMSSSWKDQGIVFGTNFFNYFYGELGYYRSSVYAIGGFPIQSTTWSAGTEFTFVDGPIIAPKIQGRLHFLLLDVGLSALCYTDLSQGYAVKLRPEIGIGFYNFDFNYGYNLGLFKNDFERANKHLLTLRYYLKLKRGDLKFFNGEGIQVE
mgnify:CR=1 FL=1